MTGLIYNQNHIPKDQYRYGLRASADTGCGWVATHNALCLMGYKTDLKELIRYYEWQLPLVHGNAGTSFWGPAVCFRNWGFPIRIIVDRKRFDEKPPQRTAASSSTAGTKRQNWVPTSWPCTIRTEVL